MHLDILCMQPSAALYNYTICFKTCVMCDCEIQYVVSHSQMWMSVHQAPPSVILTLTVQTLRVATSVFVNRCMKEMVSTVKVLLNSGMSMSIEKAMSRRKNHMCLLDIHLMLL